MELMRFNEHQSFNEMIAYHGSPRSFDYFSSNMNGTGEGASGWGYGFYFTTDKEDAKDYAFKLERDYGEGRLYKVRIPDLKYYLDLDLEIEKQSPFVLNAIRSMKKKYKIKLLGREFDDYKERLDADIANGEYDFQIDSPEYFDCLYTIFDEIEYHDGRSFFEILKQQITDGYEYEASEFLYELGIKGNTHTGFGTRHIVVFKDDDIDILQVTKPRKVRR